ncbi:spore germination protein GerPC [Chengkuizengella axinellae]|uniref:Spore germination protein GerPC n=1 Tax=Chengkuizengella axinellae TaxID=3064388 RepID=A0ABT9IT22_9BACL|nr:spore germination protein GerPC [Chengkuizengella sp. 2205SS18-9]MDP5272506.1 spore germination protein GerPC [Chengkuizengella sp. 2205SS18-9]
MYVDPQLEQYIKKLSDNINQHQNKLNDLEKLLTQMKEDMNKLMKNGNHTIEKIEYNFDQLKVETLEGTLNIGITPGGKGSIEEFEVNGQTQEDVEIQTIEETDQHQGIRDEIHQHLDKEVPNTIRALQDKFNLVIGEEYTQNMIEDIKRQIDGRVNHYLNGNHNGLNDNEIKHTVINKTKKDIETSILDHFHKITGKEMENG